MFSVDFLNQIRAYEFGAYVAHFPKGCRILEIGGGTGIQAKMLSELGYDIESIDIPNSNYADSQIFPITLYDGHHIPFPDNSFDVIFSSNVLEHIAHLEAFQAETRRVLRPDGICIHAMPSATWVLWTIVTHYLSIIQQLDRDLESRFGLKIKRDQPINFPRRSLWHLRRAWLLAGEVTTILFATLSSNRCRILPPRHGEYGNVLTELVTFARFAWKRCFRRCGYDILEIHPMGLFYTGYMFLGEKWSLSSRARWASVLGSACILYKVRPRPYSSEPIPPIEAPYKGEPLKVYD